MPKTMGYQGLVYVGTAGSTASTQILQRVDVSYDIGVQTGSTTAAGDGTSVPIETGEATSLKPSIEFNMIVDTNDAVVTTIMAAVATGAPIALRYIRSSGKLGFDCDCVVSAKQGSPLGKEATIDVKVEQVSASLRTPILNG